MQWLPMSIYIEPWIKIHCQKHKSFDSISLKVNIPVPLTHKKFNSVNNEYVKLYMRDIDYENLLHNTHENVYYFV